MCRENKEQQTKTNWCRYKVKPILCAVNCSRKEFTS